MDATNFVMCLRELAVDQSVASCLRLMTHPPGRRPDAELTALSTWLTTLTDDDRKHVESVLRLAAMQSLYSVLLLLDGLDTIESCGPKGRFELTWRHGEAMTVINDPVSVELSALLKGLE